MFPILHSLTPSDLVKHSTTRLVYIIPCLAMWTQQCVLYSQACDNPDQILKLETPVFAGKVTDIAWSSVHPTLVTRHGTILVT